MNDAFESGEVPRGEPRLSAVEQLLRDAEGLIDVSDDLRARTIDQACFVVHDRRVRRRFLLVVLAWIALSSAFGPQHPPRTPTFGHVSLDSIVTSHDVFVLADAKSMARRTDLSWALVDIFRELRERRADLMHEPRE